GRNFMRTLANGDPDGRLTMGIYAGAGGGARGSPVTRAEGLPSARVLRRWLRRLDDRQAGDVDDRPAGDPERPTPESIPDLDLRFPRWDPLQGAPHHHFLAAQVLRQLGEVRQAAEIQLVGLLVDGEPPAFTKVREGEIEAPQAHDLPLDLRRGLPL